MYVNIPHMDPLKPFGIKLFCPIGILEFSLLWMLGRNPKEGRWARRLGVKRHVSAVSTLCAHGWV